MKNTIVAIIVIIIIGFGIYFFKGSPKAPVTVENPTATSTATTTPEQKKPMTVIGSSVEGRDIVAYHYGMGEKEILFVAGLHGGYEWNTVLAAGELMDYLKENPTAVPANETVTVIPVVNPDGLNKVTGSATVDFSAGDVSAVQSVVTSGRFNANNVDLNRNFDCDWQAQGVWQTKSVSGGTSAFSEPESLAIKNYIEASKPDAVVVYYSSAGGVYSSSCHNGVSAETKALTNTYAKASGYPAYESFDFYATTGDMVNWLAKNNIPAISVLLTNHTDTEWSKNKAGIEAVLKAYSK